NDANTKIAEQAALLKELGPRQALASRAIAAMGSDTAAWEVIAKKANATTDEQNKELSELAAYWAHVGTVIDNTKSKLILWTAEVLKGTELAGMANAVVGPSEPEHKPGAEAGGGVASGTIDRSGAAAAKA